MVDIDPTRTATSYVATDLAPGSEYWWNVTAYAVAGLLTPPSTTPSNVLAVGQPLAAQLSSPSNTSTSVQLNWTNSARYGGGLSFGSYAIEVVQGHSTTLYANVTSRATLGADVTGLTSGASYSFYVETFDRVGGCGGATPTYTVTPSNTVTAGTPAPLYVTVASARPSVDVGQADAFACTPSGGLPPYTFGWNFTNGSSVFVSEPSATSHAYATPAPSGVTVTCEVKDHASSTLTAATTVFVDPAPRVLATVSPLNVSVGSSVGFQCTASGGTPPLTVGWALGNGGRISSSGGESANGTASYANSGTYVAQCLVTDALGVRAVASVVVHVRASPPFAWVTPIVVLSAGGGTGLVTALAAAFDRRRRGPADRSSAMARWLPPAGPGSTVHGAKVCPKCGASNVPLRRTCQVCGTPLPRSPSP